VIEAATITARSRKAPRINQLLFMMPGGLE
jgi:hypothetical protein